jgi:hypothetical protein
MRGKCSTKGERARAFLPHDFSLPLNETNYSQIFGGAKKYISNRTGGYGRVHVREADLSGLRIRIASREGTFITETESKP